MNGDPHEQARELLAESWLGPLDPAGQRWLEEHLAACAACAAEADRLRDAVAGLRSVPGRAGSVLVQATRRSARLYADRLREAESRERMILLSSALAAAWGALTLPWFWRAIGWLVDLARLPDAASLLLTMFLWTLPAIAAAVLLAFGRPEEAGPAAFTARRLHE